MPVHRYEDDGIHEPEILSMNISHRVIINGELLEKYIAVMVGRNYTKYKNKV